MRRCMCRVRVRVRPRVRPNGYRANHIKVFTSFGCESADAIPSANCGNRFQLADPHV